MSYSCLLLEATFIEPKVSMATAWSVRKGGLCSESEKTLPQKVPCPSKNKPKKGQKYILHTTHSPSNINFKACNI